MQSETLESFYRRANSPHANILSIFDAVIVFGPDSWWRCRPIAASAFARFGYPVGLDNADSLEYIAPQYLPLQED